MERYIPPSYRFAPTEEEIITHYLYNKVNHKLISTSNIKECDLYGNENEWIKIFEQTGELSLYFFTELKKKNKEGFRVERETRSGTWRTQNNTKIFKYIGGKKRHIGSRRNFIFVPKNGSQVKGRWMMHEYRLDGVLLNARSDCVLCRIKKKKPLTREEPSSSDDAAGIVTSMNLSAMIPVSDDHKNSTNEVHTANITDWDNAQDLEKMLLVDDDADSDFSLGISLEDLGY